MTRRVLAALVLTTAVITGRAQALHRVGTPEVPPFAAESKAGLVFPGSREAQDAFYAKLDSLISGKTDNVHVWHVGGSHVQAGHLPYRLMTDFRLSTGLTGERGLIFPMILAHSNANGTVKFSCRGEWYTHMCSKRPKEFRPALGLTGIAAGTSDPDAEVGFNMTVSEDTTWKFSRLIVHGYASSESTSPYILYGDEMISGVRTEGGYGFTLPEATDSAVIRINFGREDDEFVLTGIEPINGERGVCYYCSGINGARLTSWLDGCECLGKEVEAISPDLAILALGINDSSCRQDEFRPEVFMRRYRSLIGMIRKAKPDCAVIFITNNDSYRYARSRMTYNANAPAVRDAMMQLARECGGAVWDLYGFMGGKGSANAWRDAGLMRNDRLHFTKEGYILLADMLFNAIADDYNMSR